MLREGKCLESFMVVSQMDRVRNDEVRAGTAGIERELVSVSEIIAMFGTRGEKG